MLQAFYDYRKEQDHFNRLQNYFLLLLTKLTNRGYRCAKLRDWESMGKLIRNGHDKITNFIKYIFDIFPEAKAKEFFILFDERHPELNNWRDVFYINFTHLATSNLKKVEEKKPEVGYSR